ncbi:hypothetical protein [Halomonas getboli]|uniref:hypothetical protein n=1 Tax=Halomonas getboli TaxID=2935862 RepID=UPI001FFE8A56|nr:hypothetical protein [Halomonas getboli]MCK2183500.1 hypothetical protein [Halomonas getboli]
MRIHTEKHRQRLAVCETCPHAILTVRGACTSCGKHQTVTGHDDASLACKHCGGEVHPKGRLDFQVPRCGACGCALAMRVFASCPKKKW